MSITRMDIPTCQKYSEAEGRGEGGGASSLILEDGLSSRRSHGREKRSRFHQRRHQQAGRRIPCKRTCLRHAQNALYLLNTERRNDIFPRPVVRGLSDILSHRGLICALCGKSSICIRRVLSGSNDAYVARSANHNRSQWLSPH